MKSALAVIYLVCFLSSVYAIFGPQLKDKLLKTEDDCLTKTVGLNEKQIRIIDIVRVYRSLPPDGRLDKFAICILQRYHVLNDDGTVNEDVDKYYLISDDPKRKDKGKKCKAKTGSSNEETARKILECFLNTDIYMIDAEPRIKVPVASSKTSPQA